MFEEIAFLGIESDDAPAAAALFAIRIDRHAFDIPAVGDGHERFFFSDQVLHFQIVGFGHHNLCPARTLVFVFNLVNVFTDYIQLQIAAGQ